VPKAPRCWSNDGRRAEAHPGQGIDVDLAAALADTLGMKVTPLPFQADENMDDDLRNMVWQGHYLGFGPADACCMFPSPRRDGWVVGLAVKKDAGELAAALQGAVDGLIADMRMQQIFSKGNVAWRPA
jgi:hypothetical protein